ncbi:uncharacterized protein MYCFIDRAFT_173165 [Pseudocercospora fijiensis CIRAD86]|uniref:Uncharacterized protein n=1 Tax=Pseudocercospora fijiensis (strain CIRAD86) TaxID=383855 RepID=M3B433_PSEFD|nr:uncharacterized protein MYCFIDRAFT_173165 [Pseudocercospora fijiensis CIRAD86]EME84117.1 hypothetical protein MYCFIDRAFT_173165 [Pseudocercospora fijiensis CIRAD86]
MKFFSYLSSYRGCEVLGYGLLSARLPINDDGPGVPRGVRTMDSWAMLGGTTGRPRSPKLIRTTLVFGGCVSRKLGAE